MILLDGKKVASEIRQQLAREISREIERGTPPPGLAVILVGADPASQVYVRNKDKACREVGIASFMYELPPDSSMRRLQALIGELNGRPDVNGILLQLPLPAPLDPQPCLDLIDPAKDVDGFSPVNMGRLVLDLPGLVPCTPAGVLCLLKYYGLSTAGKNCVVLGRSTIVGKPLALLLLNRHNNATVTVCHSATADLAKLCRQADFVFAAVGRPDFVTADMIKPGAVVVDIGINRTASGLRGDVDFASVSPLTSAITPVPGGVGPMTIAMLLQNTVRAWRVALGLPEADSGLNQGSPA